MKRLSPHPSYLVSYTHRGVNLFHRSTQVVLRNWRTAALVRQRLVGALLNPAQ